MRAEAQDLVMAAGAGAEPAPPPCAREAVLLAQARDGDTAAFGELYRELGAMVHAVLLARVAPADAEDLTQEVFVRAWRGLGGLRDDAALGAWLVQIARRRAVDWAREHQRRRGRERAAALEGSAVGATARGSAEGVLAAVRQLPEAYREALLMRLVAQMTGRQIAARLGMTEGSVRVHLHRGMRLLRERLSEDLR